jgi:hypothetical protein
MDIEHVVGGGTPWPPLGGLPHILKVKGAERRGGHRVPPLQGIRSLV